MRAWLCLSVLRGTFVPLSNPALFSDLLHNKITSGMLKNGYLCRFVPRRTKKAIKIAKTLVFRGIWLYVA
jgi:hypothetical protein